MKQNDRIQDNNSPNPVITEENAVHPAKTEHFDDNPEIAEENAGFSDEIDLVFGENAIRTHRPDPVSRHSRHREQYRRRHRRLIVTACILSALVLLASLAWYLYSPIYGYGDLSEYISGDMIGKARSRFTFEEYNDKKEGVTLTYQIFIPDKYDRTKHYPLMFCVADAYSTGLSAEKPLRSSFCGAVWATEREQAKHPCFVVVPCYPEDVTGSGGGNFTYYTDITSRMLDEIVRKYHINASEVFATGQGMGASLLMYLAAEDPDRFASLLLVDGGAEIPSMTDLSRSRFIYIAAEGDSEGIEGQRLVQEQLAANGAAYGTAAGLDAEAPIDALNDDVNKMLQKNYNQNFITWKKGSVGFSLFVGEQRAAYRYGYRSDAVRDWIFEEQEMKLI